MLLLMARTLSRRILDNRGYRGFVTIYFRLSRLRTLGWLFSVRPGQNVISDGEWRMLPARNQFGDRCGPRSACLAWPAVEGNAPIRLRVGLSKAGAWTLRACLYACGGLALTFMLGLILTVIFARPAAAAQNPVVSGSGLAPPGVAGQAAGDVVSSVASSASSAVSSVASSAGPTAGSGVLRQSSE